MMRSLYSGVSGLKTHQIKMDVIGNNIANVNTVAFKSQSITFSELMYQTTQKASGPNADTGRAGVNAKQIGLGVSSAAISTQIATQGSSQNTGNAFDLRISGDAFFVVNGGNGNKFTRDGSFYVDAAGNLAMSSNGYHVMGWQVNEEGEIVQDNVSKLKVLSEENMTSDPAATEKATMEGIVDKNDPQVLSKDGKVVNLSFYDNLGYAYTARFRVNGTDAEGNYVLRLQDILNSNNESIINDTYDNEGNLISEGKYDVTIFTGNTDSGTTTFAQKHSEYSVMDGFTLVDNTGKVKLDAAISFNGTDYAKDTILDPVTIFNSDPPADEDLAKLYATAFGFDDYNDLLNLTLYEKTNPNESPMRVGDLLKSGATSLTVTDQNSTTDDTTDDTPGTVYLFDTASKSIITEGYSVPAGDAVSLVYNQTTGAFAGIGGNANVKEFNISIKPKADNPVQQNPFENISVNLEMTSNVNNEKKSTIGATSGDKEGKYTGWAVGTMTGVSIQNDGKIYGAYDNGQTKLLGQIAFATFANAAGLEKEGDNLYSATLNSGEFDGIGVDVTAQGGSVSSGILEMSNVDLSTEFTELITTQRGFQANSRIITVSDTLLEELVNLKR